MTYAEKLDYDCGTAFGTAYLTRYGAPESFDKLVEGLRRGGKSAAYLRGALDAMSVRMVDA